MAEAPGGNATTDVHHGPRRPAGPARRAALVCAFPRSLALAPPHSGTTIGRAWLEEHGLSDTEVSSAHLRFDRAGGAIRVIDVGSRNGSWVDGRPLVAHEPVSLSDGSLLRMGRTLFVVREQLAGPLEPSPPIGALVGPYGLRAVAATVDGLSRQRPNNVLIEGDTGTGKELTARAIAAALGRERPYGPVNVASVASGVFESQLFGHLAGAFSGARDAAPGLFVAHDGGTVFLDEIGELGLELQAKLLRLLDNREVLAVGADRPTHVDVLVLAATNRSLEDMVEAGDFRADLYARLSRARVALPALSERAEDIYPIAQHLMPMPVEHVEVEAVERLLRHAWPRNVRQLLSALEATHRADPEPGLRLWSLDEVLGAPDTTRPWLSDASAQAAIDACGGNVTEAAKQLGVSRGKLLRFLKRGDK